jgi:hypothetical protein
LRQIQQEEARERNPSRVWCSRPSKNYCINHGLRDNHTGKSVETYRFSRMGGEEIYVGTAAQLAAERHRWEEAVITFMTWANVEQALKNQIITVFEPMYLEIVNNDMVRFSNTNAREII